MVDMTSTLAIMAFLLTSSLAQQLPSYINVCKRSDPELSKCVQKSVENIRPYLANGIPELNVPKLEPLLMKEIVASETGNLKMMGKDVKAFGASDFTVSNMRVTLDPLTVSFNLDFPELYINADYEVTGRLLLIPIKGNGPLIGNFTNCKAEVSLISESIQKDGVDYLKFSSIKIKYQIGKGNMQLLNLFGGEKILGDVVNNAINSNFAVFAQELQPNIEKSLSEIMLEIANGISEIYPLDTLLPP